MALNPATVTSLLRSTVSEGAAFAFGVAVGPVLRPEVQFLENQAWARVQTKPLEPGDAAEIVGEDVSQLSWGEGEAAQTGISADRFDRLVQAVLNAPGVPELLAMKRRGLISDADFQHGLRKARLETRWDSPLSATEEQVLSAAVYVRLFLKGWISEADMNAGGALTGYSADDMHKWFLSEGRPATAHQVFIADRRRRVGLATAGAMPDDFNKAIIESDIRPEYAQVLWDGIESYPAPFVLRTLAQSGDLTQTETFNILLAVGWNEGLAQTVSEKWTAATSGASKEATATDLLTLYDGRKATEAETVAALEQLGYDAAAAQQKLDLIAARRVVSAKGSAISDLHSAYKKGDVTDAQATTALTQLGEPAWAVTAIVDAWRTVDQLLH